MKLLRGTPFDLFGYAEVRRQERSLVRLVLRAGARLHATDNLALAQEIAALPDQIRGYEKIKLQSIRK